MLAYNNTPLLNYIIKHIHITKNSNPTIKNHLKDELEGSWIRTTIGNNVKQVSAGATPSTSVLEYWENGTIPWMSSGEIHKKPINVTEKYITNLGLMQSSTKLIEPNHVLIALAGQGKTRGSVTYNTFPLCTNQSIAAIKCDEDKINYKYLYYLLHNDYYKIRDYSSGDGRGGLNLQMIREYPIKLIIDIENQSSTVALLSQIDNLIYLVSEKKNIYNSLYLEDVLINSLRDTKVYKLHEITVIHNSARIPITANIRPIGSVPYYGANGIQSYIDGYTHKGVNLLIAEDGANDITNYPLNLTHGEVWVNNHAHVVTGEYFYVSTEYLFYYLKTVNFSPYLTGAGRYKLNLENLKQINIEIPSLKKQQIITSFLSQMDNSTYKVLYNCSLLFLFRKVKLFLLILHILC